MNEFYFILIAKIDRDGGRFRIDGILHKLLHHRRGTVHHLTGGDLIRNGIGKKFYARHFLMDNW